MRDRTKQKICLAMAALAGLIMLTGCSKMTEQFNDAPVSGNNDAPALRVSFPDGFSNVATKCDGPNRVYVAFHGDSAYAGVAVVANDPRCTR